MNIRSICSLSTTSLVGLIVGGVLFTGNGLAASFDCGKARSEVEKLICENPELSRLDEQLTEDYQAVRKAVADTKALKLEQLAWLQERNRCPDADCLKQRYESRIAQLETKTATAHAKDTSKPRYRLVAGTGYSICETYLKHLNTLPADAPPMVCDIRPNPAHNDITRDEWDITQPEWDELDVQENLNLIYEAEMDLPPYYKYQYKFRKPPKPFPTFEEWKAGFDTRIKAEEIHPKLYRTRMALVEEGAIETLIGYDLDPDACERDMQRQNVASPGGKHIFVLNENPQDPLNTIGGSDFRTAILLYRGQPYFAWGGTIVSEFRSHIELKIPVLGAQIFQPKSYGLLFRCSYELNKAQ